MLACCSVAAHAQKSGKEITYLPAVEIRDGAVEKEAREVRLTMTVDLSEMRLRTQHTMALTPVLVSRDGSREAAFPPIVVDGKTRNNVYLRARRLESVELPPYHDGEAQVIIRRRNGREQIYDYAASLPYQRWMLEGRIENGLKMYGGRTAPELRDELTRTKMKGAPIDTIRKFYADTASFGSTSAIRAGIDFFGVDHIVFATDMPFDPEQGPGYIDRTLKCIDELNLNDADKAAILHGNAQRLFHV